MNALRPASLLLAFLLSALPAAAQEAAAWKALAAGGHVALIRHGTAPPGGGDPPGFKIDDCSTQRNLDEKGREQSRALGEAFRRHGVRVQALRSSPWCRCLETGRLMAVAAVEESWPVASSEKSPDRLRALKEMIAGWQGPDTLVLVTHALTVQALIGVFPEQAEAVVLKPAPNSAQGGSLVGRIPPPLP
jgi:phosphohistidine phosphatase SixA